jgi:hypothetical protein
MAASLRDDGLSLNSKIGFLVDKLLTKWLSIADATYDQFSSLDNLLI